MQFQSDILGATVSRPEIAETTALGTAYLAGLYCGFYKDVAQLKKLQSVSAVYKPIMTDAERFEKLKLWEDTLYRELKR